MEAGPVAVDGRDAMPSTLAANLSLAEPVGAAGLDCPLALWFPIAPPDEFAVPCALHVPLTSALGEVPAEPFAMKQADPEGAPFGPLPSDPLAPKSSEADVG